MLNSIVVNVCLPCCYPFNKLLDLFLQIFSEKAHPEQFNNSKVYKVVWDDLDFKCSEMDLISFIFSEEAFELFTLEEMNAFGSFYKNLGRIDDAVFTKIHQLLKQHYEPNLFFYPTGIC